MVLQVPYVGNYKLSYRSQYGLSEGCLLHDGSSTFSVFAGDETHYEIAESGDTSGTKYFEYETDMLS
jgi:hypothetical protein